MEKLFFSKSALNKVRIKLEEIRYIPGLDNCIMKGDALVWYYSSFLHALFQLLDQAEVTPIHSSSLLAFNFSVGFQAFMDVLGIVLVFR